MSMSQRLLRPRATGFTPKSIANLELWLDAADSTSVTIATGVSAWADKSGNNRNAAQSTGSKQPIYTNTQNGKSVITFQGTDDSMQVAASTAFTTTSQTIVVVVKQNTTGDATIYSRGVGTGESGVVMRYRASSTMWLQQTNVNESPDVSATSVTTTNFNVFAVVLEPTAQAGFVNGTSVSTGAFTRTYGTNSTLWIGAINNASSWLSGDIAEFLYFSRAITASERSSLHKYLGSKWGITVA